MLFRSGIGAKGTDGRNAENERLYQEQLEEMLSAESSSAGDIISGYNNLIRHSLHMGDYGKALGLVRKSNCNHGLRTSPDASAVQGYSGSLF